MIVTTAGRTNKEMTDYAKQVAAELNRSFVKRNDIPVHKRMSSMNKMCLS